MYTCILYLFFRADNEEESITNEEPDIEELPDTEQVLLAETIKTTENHSIRIMFSTMRSICVKMFITIHQSMLILF